LERRGADACKIVAADRLLRSGFDDKMGNGLAHRDRLGVRHGDGLDAK
jgi:hypothetical protein